MNIDLLALKPNPMRDEKVDPIEREHIKEITRSITKDGFWGGVVVGKLKNGGGEVILAGHSRIKAAIAAGHTHADLFVVNDPSPEKMLRIYGMENATQRGVDSTSISGTIAGALKLLARDVLSRTGATYKRGGPADIGEPAITKFIKSLDIPGIDECMVKDQLANLKSSGDYARIIGEVEEALEAEAIIAQTEAEDKKTKAAANVAKAKQAAADRARKARQKASEKEPTFDLHGVQKHFKLPKHVSVFRKLVTGKGVAVSLPRDKQADLAAAIVAETVMQQRELTGNFIHEVISTLLQQARFGLAADLRAKLKDESDEYHLTRHQEYFESHIRAALKDLEAIIAYSRDRQDVQWSITFLRAVKIIHTMSDDLFTPRSTKPKLREIGHAATTR